MHQLAVPLAEAQPVANRSLVLGPPDSGQSIKPQNLFLDRIAARAGRASRPKRRQPAAKSPKSVRSTETIFDSPLSTNQLPPADAFAPVASVDVVPNQPIAARTSIDAPGSWENELDGLDTAPHPDADMPEALPSNAADPTADLVGRRMETFRRRYDAEETPPDRPAPSSDVPVAPPARPVRAASGAASPKVSKISGQPIRNKGGLALFEPLKGLRLGTQTASKLMRLTCVAFLGALFVVVLLQLRTPAFNFVNSGVEEVPCSSSSLRGNAPHSTILAISGKWAAVAASQSASLNCWTKHL